MKLILTSSGFDIKDEIVELLPKPPTQLKLAHIVTASNPEPDKSYVQKDKDIMIKLGFTVQDINIEGKNEQQLWELLKDRDVVCVQGGNTFYLLKHVKLSGFDHVVKRLINQGKIYIGISAGTYIACPTIEHANWKNTDRNMVNLTDLSALNLVPFLISAHFREKYRKAIETGAKKSDLPTVALYDTQAVLVIDGKWKVIGAGKREFFNGFKENYQIPS